MSEMLPQENLTFFKKGGRPSSLPVMQPDDDGFGLSASCNKKGKKKHLSVNLGECTNSIPKIFQSYDNIFEKNFVTKTKMRIVTMFFMHLFFV
jgi:hypothetical protein